MRRSFLVVSPGGRVDRQLLSDLRLPLRPSLPIDRTRRCGRCRHRRTGRWTKGPPISSIPSRATTGRTAREEKPWKTVNHAVKQPQARRYALPARRHLLRVRHHGGGRHGREADHDPLLSRRAGDPRRRPARVLRRPGQRLGAGRPAAPRGSSARRRPTRTAAASATSAIRWSPCTATCTCPTCARPTSSGSPGLNDRARRSRRALYCGPGVWRDPETGRIHIRLAHTQLRRPGREPLPRRDRPAQAAAGRSPATTTPCASKGRGTCASRTWWSAGPSGRRC